MTQPNCSGLKHSTCCLLWSLALLLAIGAVPARSESLHAVLQGEGDYARVEQLLTTLAEDRRGNVLLLSTNTEQLRNLLLQRLSLQSGSSCVDQPAIVTATRMGLAPAAIDLLSQQLAAGIFQVGAASGDFIPAGQPSYGVKAEHHPTLTLIP